MSKVLEEVMHEQTTEFLYKHKTLYMFPSRFKKSHSIDFYLSYLNEKKKKKIKRSQCWFPNRTVFR